MRNDTSSVAELRALVRHYLLLYFLQKITSAYSDSMFSSPTMKRIEGIVYNFLQFSVKMFLNALYISLFLFTITGSNMKND